MNIIEYNPLERTGRSPGLMLLSLILILLAGLLFIGPVLGYLLIYFLYGMSFMEFVDLLSNSSAYPEYRTAILGVQGLNSVGAFIIAPFIFLLFNQGQDLGKFAPPKTLFIQTTIMASIVVISFMAVNTYFGELNAEFKFPDFLAGFETWARKMEDQLMEQTRFLTKFDSVGYFLLAILVIAVIPAIGEELLFRGVIQNLFRHIFTNAHIAIWVSAFLFAAMHFQFYGLLPRMLLGAVFGYLYWWSGNIWIPILAHFINNILLLGLLYAYELGQVEFDVESTDSLPISTILLFTVICGFSLFYFRKFYLNLSDNGKLGSSV